MHRIEALLKPRSSDSWLVGYLLGMYEQLIKDFRAQTVPFCNFSYHLRWLKIVSSTYQDLDFDGSL